MQSPSPKAFAPINDGINEQLGYQELSRNIFHDDQKAFTIRQSLRPKLVYKPLMIGSISCDKLYKKGDLRILVKAAKGELPREADTEGNEDKPKVIFRAQGHEDALRYSVQAAMASESRISPRIVMYTDGSLKTDSSGFGITYKRFNMSPVDTDGTNWVNMVYGIHGIRDINAAEILAVHRALWAAVYEIADWRKRNSDPVMGSHQLPPKVIIISDSIYAIETLYKRYYDTKYNAVSLPNEFFDNVLQPLDCLLHLGSTIEIHWTPAHIGIEGNDRADCLAEMGRYYAFRTAKSNFDAKESILPFLAFSPRRKPMEVHPLHIGMPAFDFTHWGMDITKRTLQTLMKVRSENGVSLV
ncbi:hypothetical protein F4804DRAFT_334559 [Jackrogersella minutella]|nr:hypothetical protein F4804DRAFT_334559 [Jackrogersella minutella]